MESMEDDEAYAMAKSFEEDQPFEETAEVVEEEERLKADAAVGDVLAPDDASDDDPSDAEAKEHAGATAGTEGSTQTSETSKLNPVQKASLIRLELLSSSCFS